MSIRDLVPQARRIWVSERPLFTFVDQQSRHVSTCGVERINNGDIQQLKHLALVAFDSFSTTTNLRREPLRADA